jgi:nucleoside-diphosphate-sugar epimerase
VRTEVGDLLSAIQRLVPGTVIEFADGTLGDQFGIYADTKKMVESLGITRMVSLADGLGRFVSATQ